MNRQDIAILAGSLGAVLVLVVLAALAPVYRMPDGSYQRRWVWNAPTMPVGHGYDNLAADDIARLNADPRQRQILDDMRNLPRALPIPPIYIGPRHGPGRNPLGYTALLAVIGWVLFAIHKGTS